MRFISYKTGSSFAQFTPVIFVVLIAVAEALMHQTVFLEYMAVWQKLHPVLCGCNTFVMFLHVQCSSIWYTMTLPA